MNAFLADCFHATGALFFFLTSYVVAVTFLEDQKKQRANSDWNGTKGSMRRP